MFQIKKEMKCDEIPDVGRIWALAIVEDGLDSSVVIIPRGVDTNRQWTLPPKEEADVQHAVVAQQGMCDKAETCWNLRVWQNNLDVCCDKPALKQISWLACSKSWPSNLTLTMKQWCHHSSLDSWSNSWHLLLCKTFTLRKMKILHTFFAFLSPT